MRIKTTSEINTHTQDGREIVSEEGSVLEIDDEDAALVGLARSLIMSGQATHYGDVGEVEEEVDEAPDEAPPALEGDTAEVADDLEDEGER